jgi:hypothetical protein
MTQPTLLRTYDATLDRGPLAAPIARVCGAYDFKLGAISLILHPHKICAPAIQGPSTTAETPTRDPQQRRRCLRGITTEYQATQRQASKHAWVTTQPSCVAQI